MAMMARILKSTDAEAQERQIVRIKKEIEFLTEDLELREQKLRIRRK
jgi:hypothetical protein